MSRVGSTGGGRNYRSRRPLNFYGVLTIIVLVGLLSVVWARHDYTTSATSATSLPPLAGTTSYSALGIDVCGTLQPSLPSTTAKTGALLIGSLGLVQVSPSTKAEAGINANVEKMAAAYPGMAITSSTFKIPQTSKTLPFDLKNGDACPAGTKDAGKTGSVVIAYWPNFASKAAVLASNPATVRLTANSLVTVAFLPSGTTPMKPKQASINRMLVASQSGSTTPTTAPTPTTVPATTTTASSTTTSAAK